MSIVKIDRAEALIAPRGDWSREQIDVMRATIAKGTTDAEFALFLEVCRSSGLDPFNREIYAVVRNERVKDAHGQWSDQPKMVIQTGIDGYRKIAEATGLHIGTSEPEYGPDHDGHPEWARVTVTKWWEQPGGGGREVNFSATAWWVEYAATYQDKNGGQKLGAMWAKMPRGQLAKCAEALALRKAFPKKLSPLRTRDEMAQADNATIAAVAEMKAPPLAPVGELPAWAGGKPEPVPATEEQILEMEAKIQRCEAHGDMAKLVGELKELNVNEATREALRVAYKAKWAEIDRAGK